MVWERSRVGKDHRLSEGVLGWLGSDVFYCDNLRIFQVVVLDCLPYIARMPFLSSIEGN